MRVLDVKKDESVNGKKCDIYVVKHDKDTDTIYNARMYSKDIIAVDKYSTHNGTKISLQPTANQIEEVINAINNYDPVKQAREESDLLKREAIIKKLKTTNVHITDLMCGVEIIATPIGFGPEISKNCLTVKYEYIVGSLTLNAERHIFSAMYNLDTNEWSLSTDFKDVRIGYSQQMDYNLAEFLKYNPWQQDLVSTIQDSKIKVKFTNYYVCNVDEVCSGIQQIFRAFLTVYRHINEPVTFHANVTNKIELGAFINANVNNTGETSIDMVGIDLVQKEVYNKLFPPILTNSINSYYATKNTDKVFTDTLCEVLAKFNGFGSYLIPGGRVKYLEDALESIINKVLNKNSNQVTYYNLGHDANWGKYIYVTINNNIAFNLLKANNFELANDISRIIGKRVVFKRYKKDQVSVLDKKQSGYIN